MLDKHCSDCDNYHDGSAHNSYCKHSRMSGIVQFEEGGEEELCCDYFVARKTTADSGAGANIAQQPQECNAVGAK